MFDDLCPIESRFDAPVKKFEHQSLKAYTSLKKRMSNWQKSFDLILTTEESNANPIYKRKLVELYETEYSRQTYVLAGQDGPERLIVSSKHPSKFQPIKVKPTNQSLAIQRFKTCRQINMTTSGDLESMMMDIGEGVGFIKDFICC
ncbi:hypothetical protein TSUD_317620 [Trifolium subterraneum]|uniref:Uncharacterized protein n=1 Tax=Trifolium subterraneum TaxID=3900 RepID=A0A2Z6M2F9_TRISU|nr:hypothetical protein TSUD_317620 [Trifolium subterraneum]